MLTLSRRGARGVSLARWQVSLPGAEAFDEILARPAQASFGGHLFFEPRDAPGHRRRIAAEELCRPRDRNSADLSPCPSHQGPSERLPSTLTHRAHPLNPEPVLLCHCLRHRLHRQTTPADLRLSDLLEGDVGEL